MVSTPMLLAFAIYFAFLIIIAVVSHKTMRTSTDFIVGNRSLNFWVIALSAHASDMSAWLFMAFPAALYMGGMPKIWIALGLLLGMFFNWKLVALKLRQATENFQANTLSAFFEKRFHDHRGHIRILTAIMLVFFMSYYLCAGLIAMGFVLDSVFGIDYYWGLALSSLVIMGYTFAGGFITVAWTDLFQAIFLLIMIALVPFAALSEMNHGIDQVISTAQANNIPLSPLADLSFVSIANLILLAFGWGLGYFGQPHIVTKFMGIRHPEELRKSMYLGMTWQLIALSLAAFCGLVAIAYFPVGINNPELVFVEMVKNLFHPFLAGFALCGLIAANMSTMDSQVLVCSSVLSEDLYGKLINPKASPRQLLRAVRICVILITLISLGVAFMRSSTVLDTVIYAWAGLGCSFGPVILCALYYPWVNRYGAITGILVGGTVAALWNYFYPVDVAIEIPAMVPGFVLSFLSIFIVSWATNKKEIVPAV
ncbi:MAG: sodium/proline symporter [Parachlamydiales bacterium]